MMKPVHPGEVLAEDFLEPMGLSQYRLAKAIKVPLRRVNEIVLGRRGITVDTALRFAQFFGTTPELWQNLQAQCLGLDAPSRRTSAIGSQEKRLQQAFGGRRVPTSPFDLCGD